MTYVDFSDLFSPAFFFCPFILFIGMAGGKYRSFLVHIKAVCEKGSEESPRRIVRMTPAKPQCSNKAHSLSSLLQKAQTTKVHKPRMLF